jgi:hypothetical protein
LRRNDLDVVLFGTMRSKKDGLHVGNLVDHPAGWAFGLLLACAAVHAPDLFKVLPLTSSFEPGLTGWKKSESIREPRSTNLPTSRPAVP